MYLRFLVLVLSVFSLSFAAGAADVPLVTLGGEVGAADKASLNRFSSAPFDSLAWIRADLTGEKASESDDAGWGHILFRPFKNYSGDISGRFIEIMAMNARGDYNVHPAFKQLLADAQKQQRPGGYFAASGHIDWQKPVDYKDIYTSTMMPALWGNARLLCGLVEASRSFPKDASLLATARRLGDFYVGMIPRFTDPARMSEYKGGDTYAAGYVTCYFPAMEGLAKLHALTGERKYLEAAVTMAAFYKQFDRVPIDHAHGMLCNQVSLVLLYEATKNVSYLERVEKRWDELVTGGYINPAGGIMEQCKVKFGRDEGCAIVDWLRLNLALGRVTGKTRYWAMAERTLHNHFLQNQTPKGGFGHRGSLCDQEGVYGFSDSIEEAVWCCTFHGQLGFVNLRSHLLNRTAGELTCHFAVDFIAKYADGSMVSDIRPVAAAGEILRQRIRLDGLPATVLRVRQPHWADAVTALAADGTALGLESRDGYCLTTKPVSEATFIYAGGLYAEDRHCKRLPAGPVAGAAGVIGYGPKLLAAQGRTAAAPTWPTTLEALKAQGLEPFTAAWRNKECCFVSGPLSLAVSAKPVWGTSPIAEPHPYVSTGSFSGPAVPESPDPLVAYRWPSPKATDGLEIYLQKPSAVSSDTAASFDNLGSLTTDHPNVTVNGAGSIRMDFGRESAAWLEFDSPDCPGGIEMSISEYNQPAIVNAMPLHPVKTLAPVKYGNTYRLELNKELYEGVRFGWIHVRSFTGAWHITGIRLVCQVKPVNYKGSFSCSDPMLTRVWYTGAYGVKLNLLKNYLGAILMDRGDRHSWTGDAHPSQAASMAAFGNFDFIRSNLERTSGKDWIQSYMLYWVSSMLDYYNYTGDAELLKKYTENISAKLDDACKAYGTNPKLGFYGHDERIGACFEIQPRDSREAQHGYKMLSIRAWNDFAKAMESIGRNDLRDKYNGYVTEKVSQLRQKADWYQDFGVHAMSDAVNAGFTSRAEQEKMFALEYNDKVNRVSFSPFNQYFIIQAMGSMKKHDEALDSVRYLWGGMIEYGGTTFFEAFRPAWATVLGKNDPVPACQCGFTSLCHPWGGGVVKWLSEEVAGIKPVSPGFKEYAIVPHLGRSLTWVKGAVPTPHGEIGVSINVDSGEMSMSAPAGTTGRLGIPKMEKTIRSIVFDNVVVWDGVFHAANGVGGAEEDPDFVYLTKVQPGTHAITVKYSGTTPGYVEPLEQYDVDGIRQDSATGGSWGGKYGSEGYVLFSYNGANQDVRALPSYVKSLNIYNHRSVQWTNQTSELRALSPDKSNGVPRKAACIYTGNGGPTDVVRSWDGQPLTVSIEANGSRSYQVAFYFVDWDKLGRSIAVEMFDAKTLKMVAPVQVIKDHVAGCYLIYKYDKSVKFRIQQIRGGNAALGGIFFDPAPAGEVGNRTPPSGKVAVQDRFQTLPPGSVRLGGFIQDRIQQQAEYLFDEKTLAEMVDAIRKRPHRIVNGEATGLAEGEFWGKAVRSLSHHYQYSAEPRLRKLLDVTVADLMSLQTQDGCISDTVPELQPYHSDMWDRKYTLLGLVNAYETTGDPKVLASAMKLADFTLSQVGPAPKISIVNTSFNSTPAKPTGWFFGVESSSILEPMMRLHRLTGKAEYQEFARYIVEVEGCSSKGSIFEAMLAGKEARDLIGGTACHTYNIISCFEGLMGYYRATGNEKWKEAALKLYANVLAREIAIIGTCCGLGGASENFAHSALYQTCPKRKGLEACSAPRWMAFCRHLLLITGDSTFVDEYERSLYNAVWGSIRPDGKSVDYFTRLSGVRPDLEENFRRVFNGKSFTCCSYNVGDALALVPFTAVMSAEGGPVVNLYIPGTAKVKLPDGNEAAVEQTTDYPKTGEVTIKVSLLKPARFPIRLRIPGWSKQTRVTVNGKEQESTSGSYLVLNRDWVAGDRIALSLDMRCRLVRSPDGSPKSADGFRALVRGPLVLARDKRLGGNIHEEVDIQADAGGYVAVTPQTPAIPALVQFAVPTVAGGSFQVIDFATSGNTWDAQSERVTWIPGSNPAPEVEHKR